MTEKFDVVAGERSRKSYVTESAAKPPALFSSLAGCSSNPMRKRHLGGITCKLFVLSRVLLGKGHFAERAQRCEKPDHELTSLVDVLFPSSEEKVSVSRRKERRIGVQMTRQQLIPSTTWQPDHRLSRIDRLVSPLPPASHQHG